MDIPGKTLAASLLIVTAGAAQAFEPDQHQSYTRQAALLWASCSNQGLADRVLVEALAEGTDAEDTTQLWRRATNWHFYNREQKLRPFWVFERNLDRVFALRVQELQVLLAQQSVDVPAVYAQAGRVLHYIQDMSVPAHVVPVFHMAGMGDPIDKFQRRPALPPVSLSQTQCQQLLGEVKAGTQYLDELLNNAARSTLDAIAADPGWQNYWVWPARDPQTAAKGWGEYGQCHFKRGSTEPGCKNETDIEAFFEQRYRHTLLDSVRLMAWLAQQLAAKGVQVSAAKPD